MAAKKVSDDVSSKNKEKENGITVPGGGFCRDFKKFITQGKVLELAVAFIMGAAVGSVVSSLVTDIFTPIVSLVIRYSLEDIFAVMRYANSTEEGAIYKDLVSAKAAHAITLNYGRFLGSVIHFGIISLCLFLFLKILFMVKFAEADIIAPMLDCPNCLEKAKEGSTRCPHCTTKFGSPLGVDQNDKESA